MNKMKKVQRLIGTGAVAYTLLVCAILGTTITARTIREWRAEVPTQLLIKSVVLSTKSYETVHIPVPPISHNYTVEIYSAVDELPSGDNRAMLSTPRVVYQRNSELSEVIVPPIMKPGTYTVVLHAAYQLNPIKEVEQSALIAVLIVS